MLRGVRWRCGFGRRRATERGAHQRRAILGAEALGLDRGGGRPHRCVRGLFDIHAESARDVDELGRVRDPLERMFRFETRALRGTGQPCGFDVADVLVGGGGALASKDERGREATMRREIVRVERGRVAVQTDRARALTRFRDGRTAVQEHAQRGGAIFLLDEHLR